MLAEYGIYVGKDNILQVTAEVSSYAFRPDGNATEWIKYARDLAIKKGIKKFKVFSESQDKETGSVDEHLVYEGEIEGEVENGLL